MAEEKKSRRVVSKSIKETPTKEPLSEKPSSLLTDLEQFLLYLAQHANPKRFLPFPNEYRTTTLKPQENPEEIKIIGTCAKAKISVKTLQANDNKLGTSFDPYTEEEYALMKADLDKIESNPQAYPRLLKYLTTLELGMCQYDKSSIHPSITEYEFRYSAMEERIRNINYPKRWYLFHGSALGNWHSILRNGLRNMSNTSYMSDGATEGIGVYMANDLRTSYRYGAHSGYFGSQDGIHCVSVVELLIDPAPYKVPAGWYVIPDDRMMVVRYLLKLTSAPKNDGKGILEYYTKQTNTRIKDNAIPRRLESEEKTFISQNIELLEKTTNPTIWTVLYDRVVLRLYLQSFPYQPVIIQPAYKLEGPEENSEPYMPIDWSPVTTIQSALLDYTKHKFNSNHIPEMTKEPNPSLLIEQKAPVTEQKAPQ